MIRDKRQGARAFGADASKGFAYAPRSPAHTGRLRPGFPSGRDRGRSVDEPDRSAKDKARDQYRRPVESLTFWGLKPGQTVLDIQPEGGYYAEIIAPYLAQTGGTYIAGVAVPSNPWGADLSDPNLPGAKPGATPPNAARYGKVRYAEFSGGGLKLPPNSVDIVFSTREIHNWIHDGYADKVLRDIYRALKPGGILAVEEHRADPQINPRLTGEPFTGYVPTSVVVATVRKAGFELEATSELNANPADTKDYPFGVWTLPPGRLSVLPNRPALTAEQRAHYDAIGESDRMTLRFRKPAKK